MVMPSTRIMYAFECLQKVNVKPYYVTSFDFGLFYEGCKQGQIIVTGDQGTWELSMGQDVPMRGPGDGMSLGSLTRFVAGTRPGMQVPLRRTARTSAGMLVGRIQAAFFENNIFHPFVIMGQMA